MNSHHKCQKHVANLCGINQKAFSEALGQANVSYFNTLIMIFDEPFSSILTKTFHNKSAEFYQIVFINKLHDM